MTSDDLKHLNKDFYVFFGDFGLHAKHILGANCTEINRDRQGQVAYEICSSKRRFRQSKS